MAITGELPYFSSADVVWSLLMSRHRQQSLNVRNSRLAMRRDGRTFAHRTLEMIRTVVTGFLPTH